MNINRFMRKMDRELGLSMLRLQKYFPEIQRMLMEDTLYTFSQFFPYTYFMDLNLNTQQPGHAPDGGYVYYLNDSYLEQNGFEIISVTGVEGTSYFMEWNERLPTFDVEDIILNAAGSNIRSQLNVSNRGFDFLPPNRIKLFGYSGYENVKIEVKIPYPNFGAVPESISLPFIDLAKLDIQIFIYNELKHYDQLETADGNIDLKISEWADAESKKAELIETFRNKAFPNSVRKPYIYE